MSIAIAMRTRNAIVLASDTQETSDLRKRNVRKTQHPKTWTRESVPYAVAGAGYGPYIDIIRQRLSEMIEHPEMTAEKMPPTVEDVLKGFYAQHVIPFRDPDLEVAFLIGSFLDGRFSIHLTHKTAVKVVDERDAVGVGDIVALPLLETLHSVLDPIDHAVLTAAYVIWKTKQTVDGCGHDTDISVLTRHYVLRLSRSACRRFDDYFADCDLVSQSALRMMFRFTGSRDDFDEPIEESIAAMRQRFLELSEGLSQSLAAMVDDIAHLS